MPNHTADIVVVGGGVIGTSAALHLALMGAGNVILVEGSHLAGGASGLSGAMVREHYLHPVLVRMAMESRTIFENFGEVIGGDAGYQQTGRLLLFPQHDEPAVRANVAMNRDLGVNIEMLAPADATRIDASAGYRRNRRVRLGARRGIRRPGRHHLRLRGPSPLPWRGGLDPDPRHRPGRIRRADNCRRDDHTAASIPVRWWWLPAPAPTAVVGPIAEPLPIVAARVQMAHFGRPPALDSLRCYRHRPRHGRLFPGGRRPGHVGGSRRPRRPG